MNLRRSIILSALQQYGCRIIMLGVSMVVARLLTPSQMGVFAVAIGVIGLLEALRGMGVGSYFITSATLTTDDLRTQAGLSWILGLGFSALLLAVSGPAARFYGDPLVGNCLRILAVAHALNPVGAPSQLILTRDMRFGAQLWIGLAASVMQGGIAITLAALGDGPASLAWAQVASNLTSSFGAVVSVPAVAFLRPSLRDWRRPFQFGGWLTAAGIAGGVGTQAGRLITGRVLGLASTALYGRALSTADLIKSLFYGAVMAPVLPALAQAERDAANETQRIYLRLVAVITGLCWPAYVALAIWSGPVVVLLYGEQWRASAELLPAVCVANMLAFAAMPYHEVLIARQRVRLFFFCESGLLAVWLVMLLLAAPWGLQVLVWVQVLASAIALAVYLLALRQTIGLRMRSISTVWAGSMLPTVAVAVVAALIRLSPISTSWPLLVVLALTALLGGLAWLAAIRVVNHELWGQVVEASRWGRRKMLIARS